MNVPPDAGGSVSLTDSLVRLQPKEGSRFIELFEHRSVQVELFRPTEVTDPAVHDRDEFYVVVRGRGVIAHGTGRTPVGPGDFLYVPARLPHRFEEFSDDLTLWMTLIGPAAPATP